MSWDYSDLSSLAKKNGGPAALIEKIHQDGIERGKESMEPVAVLMFIGGIAVCKAGEWVFTKAKNMLAKRKTVKEDLQEYETIRDELIEGINRYDQMHSEIEMESDNELHTDDSFDIEDPSLTDD